MTSSGNLRQRGEALGGTLDPGGLGTVSKPQGVGSLPSGLSRRIRLLPIPSTSLPDRTSNAAGSQHSPSAVTAHLQQPTASHLSVLNRTPSPQSTASASNVLTMDLNNIKKQVSNLTLYDIKAGVRKMQNGRPRLPCMLLLHMVMLT